VLSTPDPTFLQRFALRYYLYMSRRLELQDREDNLQQQLWYNDPERYQWLFIHGLIGDRDDQQGVDGEESQEEEMGVYDLDVMDSYFEQLDEKRTMTGAHVFGQMAAAHEGAWV
jgi:hypothetical protein